MGIMPNHVHFLIETISEHPLSGVPHSLKSFTAKKANKLLGRAGQFWQMEYFDGAIRGERHWLSAI
jgi:REP element-mobilizing transposase RayT